jgi:hypothetical protein
MAKRETIPYGVTPKDRRPPQSGERRRTSPTSKTLSGPMVAPRVPDPVVVLATGAGSASPTAVTQPMPAVSLEAHEAADAPARDASPAARPAIPPPGPEQGRRPTPAAGEAAQDASAGAYRFTAPDTERRRKRR